VPTPSLLNRTAGLWLAFGRLADGVSIERARVEMDTIGRRLAAAYPLTNEGVAPVVHTFDDFFIGPNAKAIYGALLGAAGFVLLIACANLANLLLGRAVGRAREIAVRVALGAARSRIMRQLVIESLTLSTAGGALGWLIAKWSVRLYEAAAVPSGQFTGASWFDHVLDFGLDDRGLIYLVVISFATGVVFGLAPAVRLSVLAEGATMKDGGRGATAGADARRLSMLLVMGETALAVVLLTGAGVLVKSFLNLSATNVGVKTDHVLAMLVRVANDEYPDADSQVRVFDRLSGRLALIAGVDSVAMASSPPAGGATVRAAYELADAPLVDEQRRPTVLGVTVSPGYFRTMGASVLAGREFGDFDRAAAPAVALVNHLFAHEHWPGQDAVGKRLRLSEGGVRGSWLTVVGVVSDVAQSPVALQRFDPLVYLPMAQHPASGAWVLARTRIPPAGLVASFRQEVPGADPKLLVWLGPFPLADRLAASYAFNGVVSVLSLVFAGIALLLAVIGIYAVVSNFVHQRTQEIGVRIAMGATTRQILAFVYSRGMRAVLGGVVVGLVASAFVNRLLSVVLVGVAPVDPLTIGTASIVLVLAAAIGCAVPAGRAIAVDPVVALRHE
jgi:putative ABC transport system permease protein